MRPEGAWSMSTVGLTAQETSFPLENPFLWGSYCHSMADSKSSWGYPHEASHNFSIKSAYTDPKVHSYHKDPPPQSPSFERHKPSPVTQRLPKKCQPPYLSLSCTPEPSTPSPSEDNQILSLPHSVYKGGSPPQTPGRSSKPLPPIPFQTDTCPDQTMDNEVEYFTNTDESCRLVPDQVIKPVRYELVRRSLRIKGQVNPAFCDHGPQSPRPPQTQHHHHIHAPHEPPRQEPPRQESPEILICSRQLDKTQRRVRRTQSGPPGSFNKPSFLNLQSHKRNTHSMYKPEVPPPIPPRPHKVEDHRRWSEEVSSGAYSDKDKPPKLPPRDKRGSSRTPSPNGLPLYVNGEMPPTQSFAPDPKYVYLQRQHSFPCILPVIENGQKVSHTHYFLLDGPPARNMDVPNSEWDYHSQKNASVDFV